MNNYKNYMIFEFRILVNKNHVYFLFLFLFYLYHTIIKYKHFLKLQIILSKNHSKKHGQIFCKIYNNLIFK